MIRVTVCANHDMHDHNTFIAKYDDGDRERLFPLSLEVIENEMRFEVRNPPASLVIWSCMKGSKNGTFTPQYEVCESCLKIEEKVDRVTHETQRKQP